MAVIKNHIKTDCCRYPRLLNPHTLAHKHRPNTLCRIAQSPGRFMCFSTKIMCQMIKYTRRSVGTASTFCVWSAVTASAVHLLFSGTWNGDVLSCPTTSVSMCSQYNPPRFHLLFVCGGSNWTRLLSLSFYTNTNLH